MICKDEESMLPGCLESVRESVDEIIVADTGSSDATIEVARDFGAKVISVPWTDFSTARNQSLDVASGDWALVLDADEELVVEAPGRLHELIESDQGEAYLVQMVDCKEMTEFIDLDNSPRYASLKLFRRDGARYINPVHERVLLPDGAPCAIAADVLVVHYGYLKDVYDERGKSTRHAVMLEDWYDSDPTNASAAFYLARDVHYKAKDYSRAIELFQEAQWPLVNGGDTFLGGDSFIHLVGCFEKLGQSEKVEATFVEGASVYPDFVELRYFFGCFLLKQGRFLEAIEQFLACLGLSELDFRFHVVTRGADGFRASGALKQAFLSLRAYDKAWVAGALTEWFQGRPLSTFLNDDDTGVSPRAKELVKMMGLKQGRTVLEAVAEYLR